VLKLSNSSSTIKDYSEKKANGKQKGGCQGRIYWILSGLLVVGGWEYSGDIAACPDGGAEDKTSLELPGDFFATLTQPVTMPTTAHMTTTAAMIDFIRILFGI
jgi:hypothetical protein